MRRFLWVAIALLAVLTAMSVELATGTTSYVRDHVVGALNARFGGTAAAPIFLPC